MSSPITGFFGAGICSVVVVYGIAYFIAKDERLTERILRDTVSLLFCETATLVLFTAIHSVLCDTAVLRYEHHGIAV